MKNWRRKFLLLSVVIVIFAVTAVLNLFSAPFVIAQEEKSKLPKEKVEEADKALVLETMTVTARKKEENVQDVPMGISVFSHIQLLQPKVL